MVKEIKLENGFWFSDYNLIKISKKLRGNSIVVLMSINTRIKVQKIDSNSFSIPTVWLEKLTGFKKKSILREIKYLIDRKVLVKQEPGVYCWNLSGINSLYEDEDPNRTEQPHIRLERVVMGPKVEDPIFEGLDLSDW